MKLNKWNIFVALCATGVVLQVRTAQDSGPSGSTSGIIADQSADASGSVYDESLDEQLVQAAREGDTEKVRELLNAGADANFSDDLGDADSVDQTPLSAASGRGHVDVVRALIAGGARVDHTAPDVSTALYFAADAGHIDVVQVLLAAGASTLDLGETKMHPLMGAAYGGHLGVVRLLVRAGADVNAKNCDDETALMRAAMEGHAEVVRLLLAAGADVNASNSDGVTALEYASQRRHWLVVRALLVAGAVVPHSLMYQMQPVLVAGSLDFNSLLVHQLLVDGQTDSSVVLSEMKSKIARIAAADALSSDEISQKLGLFVSEILGCWRSQRWRLIEIAEQLAEAGRQLSSSSNTSEAATVVSQFKERMQQKKGRRLQLLNSFRDCALDCVRRGAILPDTCTSNLWENQNKELRQLGVELDLTRDDRLLWIYDTFSEGTAFGADVSKCIYQFAEPLSEYRHLLSLLRQKDRTIAQLRVEDRLKSAPSRSASSQERPESNRPRKRQRTIEAAGN